jgi:hypothetical protein
MAAIKYVNQKGDRVPGVTTVIGQNLGWNKNALLFWANKCGLDGRYHYDVSQKAADSGTCAHKLIEAHIKGIECPDTFSDEILEKGEMALLNFVQWSEMVEFEPLQTELSIVSNVMDYGGTIDCIAKIRGKKVLFDWKSGSGVYPDHIIQLEAYRHLYDEWFSDVPIEDGFTILRIDKETVSFDWAYRYQVPEAWEAFQILLRLHQIKPKVK